MQPCSKRSKHSRKLSSPPLGVLIPPFYPRRDHCLSRRRLPHPGALRRRHLCSRQTRTKTCLPQHLHASPQRRFGVAAAPHSVALRQCTPSQSPTSSQARPSSQLYRRTLTLRLTTTTTSTASASRRLAGRASPRRSMRLWTRIRLP